MNSTYKILEDCINSKNLSYIVNKILDNYKKIIDLKNLKKYSINLEKFKLEIYSKDNSSFSNLLTMYRILEKNFYYHLKKMNFIKLDYNQEIASDNSNNYYLTIITDNKLNLDIFKVYLLFYYLNLKFSENVSYLGVDFEFNTKKVALMQINFEQINKNLFDCSLIFIFDPKQFNKNWKLFFIQKIFCNLNCYKILHGSDSLDIPYVYEELLFNDEKYIKKFNEKFIDTKFLCEYKYFLNDKELGKCKIYNVLKDEGIISSSKYNELLENDEKMGPIYDIIINVNKLSKNLIYYTLYDVLFLPHLVKSYHKMQNFNLIIELTQFIFLEKRGITNIIPISELNNINNYIIISNGKQRLNNLFQSYFSYFSNKNKLITNLLKINYFKKTLINLFKFLYYRYLCSNNKVYIKISNNKIPYKNSILDYKFDLEFKNFEIVLNNFLKGIKKY